MRNCILILLVVCFWGCKKKADSYMVYICTSSDFNTYHRNKKCQNLTKCTSDILFVHMDDRNLDRIEYEDEDWYVPRKECGLCYGK